MLRALLLSAVLVTVSIGFPQINEEKIAEEFLVKTNKKLGEFIKKAFTASWKYDSNLTDANLAEKINVFSETAKYRKKLWESVKGFPWSDLQDEDLKRQFEFFSIIGEAVLSEQDFMEYQNNTSQMTRIYSTAKICEYKNPKNCKLSLKPEIEEIMAKSRDAENLKHVWIEWREASAKKMKSFYPKNVELGNEAARKHGYDNKSVSKSFQDEIETLWQEIRPLYLQVHAYVRSKLVEKYGNKVVSEDGPIPAHLLGNMWAQTWINIADFTLPFSNKTLPDATPAMVEQDYDAINMRYKVV